ncbi:hypothetical protein [Enterococcus sp. N249-2]
MNKLISLCLVSMMFLGLSVPVTVYGEEVFENVDTEVDTEVDSEAINPYVEEKLTDQEILEQEQALGDQIASNNSSNPMLRSATGQTWKLVKTRKLTTDQVVATQYVQKLDAKTSKSKSVSFSFGINAEIKGVKLSTSFSYSTSMTRSGPSNEKIVGTQTKASHAYFTAAIWGYVNEYTYDVYDNGSGKKIKTVKQNGFIRTNTQGYSQNAYTRKDGKVMVENASGTKYKTFNSHDSFVNGFGRGKSSNLWW